MTDLQDIDDIKGVSSEEQQYYNEMLYQIEKSQGQTTKEARVRFAIHSFKDFWLIDDIQEMTGVDRETIQDVVTQERCMDHCEIVITQDEIDITIYDSVN